MTPDEKGKVSVNHDDETFGALLNHLAIWVGADKMYVER